MNKKGDIILISCSKKGTPSKTPVSVDITQSFRDKLGICPASKNQKFKLSYPYRNVENWYYVPDFMKKISIMSPFFWIGIAGCGGLGSNCAANLVRAGFENFILVDFDKVERFNLNRQFYFHNQIGKLKVKALAQNLKKINPHLKIETFKTKLNARNTGKIFAGCGVIVEGFDKASLKKMIAEKIIPTGKLLVSASGICGAGKSDNIKVHKLKPNFILVGDLKTCSTKTPPISPRVNIAAAKQADAILEYVLKRFI